MAKTLVGGPTREDVESTDPRPEANLVECHNIPVGFKAQWMREDEVRQRLQGDYFKHPITGKATRIKPWQVVHWDEADVTGGTAADGVKGGVDTAVRKGNTVLMILDEVSHAALEAKQEARADLMEQALANGSADAQEVRINGEHSMIVKPQRSIAAHPSRAKSTQAEV